MRKSKAKMIRQMAKTYWDKQVPAQDGQEKRPFQSFYRLTKQDYINGKFKI